MTTKRRKTQGQKTQGHKRAQVSRGIRIICECGWESAMYFGKDRGAGAASEHDRHAEEHSKAEA